MKQSRLMSLVESVPNVVVGYGVAVVTQILIFPVFGRVAPISQLITPLINLLTSLLLPGPGAVGII